MTMRNASRRMAMAAAGAASFASLALLVLADGCGGSSSTEGPSDATTTDGPVVIVTPMSDATVDAGDSDDDGDAAATDARVIPSDAGHCSPANGDCDVVLNNCPASSGVPGECLPGDTPGKSTCFGERASQHLPLGHTCCPSDRDHEPCLPGLECFGDLCVDGGTPTARCSPRCCDNSVCGKSVPEGIVGSCNLDVVDDNGDSLYQVCTYERPCRPFHVQPCPAGQVCQVTDKLGTSTCVSEYLPNGGDGSEGVACAAENSCAEGLGCLLSSEDAGADAGDASTSDGTCYYFCVVPGTTPPFDAGADGGAGYGGCPSGEICNLLDPTQFPTWLGYCAAP